MDMLAASLLLLPFVATLILGSLYGSVVNALNPGNEVMTASNYTFRSDTFSAAGAIGSLSGDKSDPSIITGRWSVVVQGGSVSSFSSNLTMVNASGDGYRSLQLSNMTSAKVTVKGDLALVTGFVDITVNDTERLSGVNATISLTKLRALNMTLSAPDYLTEPIYGTADPPHETSTASNLLPEGSGIFGSVTEKFRLPQLPDPFR